MPNTYLQQRLTVLLDGPSRRSLKFRPVVLDGTSLAPFAGFLCELETSFYLQLSSQLFVRSSSITDAVADAFIMSVPSNCSDLLHRKVLSIAPRQVKRALDYIHSNPKVYRDPEALAALSNVSVRSLQYTFKETTGYSISEYQTILRLQGAREEVATNSALIPRPDEIDSRDSVWVQIMIQHGGRRFRHGNGTGYPSGLYG